MMLLQCYENDNFYSCDVEEYRVLMKEAMIEIFAWFITVSTLYRA